LNKYLDFKEYIFVSYAVPFLSSDAIKVVITGYTKLGPFKVDAIGIQARFIGLWFLFFSLIIMYFVLIKIPKSIEAGKVRECINIFILSPFFITWILCIILKIFEEYLQYGTLLFFLMIIICFFFQLKFNKILLSIYEQ